MGGNATQPRRVESYTKLAMTTAPPKHSPTYNTNPYNHTVKVAQNNGLGGREDSLS